MHFLLIAFLFCCSSFVKAEDLWPDPVFLSITGEAATQGDPNSQLLMGLFHELGWGVPQNFEEAAMWYSHAIQNDNQAALRRLGILTFYGLGVPQDEELGILLALLGPSDDLFPDITPEQQAVIDDVRQVWKKIQSKRRLKINALRSCGYSRTRGQSDMVIRLASDRWEPADVNERFYGPGTGDWNVGISRSEYEHIEREFQNLAAQINEFQD